jgi:biotin carboxylase
VEDSPGSGASGLLPPQQPKRSYSGSSQRQVIAVVDPVAAGAPYGAEINAMGLTPIGVLTSDFTDAYTAQSLQRQEYAELYRHRTAAATISFLKDREVAAVVPGDQLALEWSDLFAHALDLPGNPVESMTARFNKTVMKEHWAAHGVPCANWLESGDLQAVLAWAKQGGYPVVLKPNASTGSCHVFRCDDEREVTAAFEVITKKPDVDGRNYDTVLAEEYLDGEEYFIDLRHDGTGASEIVSIGGYEKLQRHGRASIYRTIRSLDLNCQVAREALPVVKAANAALAVRRGINDCEFKMTSRGPKVIEINNRLPGAGTARMIYECTGLNCYQETVRLYLGKRPGHTGGIRFRRHYSVCCLVNDQAGKVTGYEGADEVAGLPSFDDLRFIAKPGDFWPVTNDLTTAWGLVWLVNEDEARLDRDTRTVHEMLRLRVE